MADKYETISQLTTDTTEKLTGSYQEWTAFLTTAARLYKYPFLEQVMIYAQRPEATACADYDVWNRRMRRYIRRGSAGIALIDNSGNRPTLRYVFDVSDTGGGESAKRPYLWQYREDHRQAVMEALETRYGVSAADGLDEQLEQTATQLAAQFWDEYRDRILGIIDGSHLQDYDEADIREAFLSAASVSITYSVMSRCGMEPDNYFRHEDFLSIFDFNSMDTIVALGSAVSSCSESILRQIEITIKKYEREHSAERTEEHGEQTDLQAQRGLSDTRPDDGRDTDAGPRQVREDAQEVSGGTRPDPVEHADLAGDAVPAPVGDRGRGERETGADDAGAGEVSGRDGGTESSGPDALGWPDEHLQGASGGNDLDGAGVRVEPVQGGEQFSLFPSQAQQMQYIAEAESVDAPSAFGISQEEIDAVLIFGSNTDNARMKLVTEFSKSKMPDELTAFVKQIFHGGYGIQTGYDPVSAWYAEDGIHLAHGRSAEHNRAALVLSWEDAAARIGELLEQGRFATNVELVEAPGLERHLIAESLLYVLRDVSEEGREKGWGALYAKSVGFKGGVKAMYRKYVESLKIQGNTIYIGNETLFSDAPLVLDAGEWEADDDGVRKKFGYDTIVACSHPILPVERLINIDTGMEKLTLAYRHKNGPWRRVVADKDELKDARSVTCLYKKGVSVTSENAKFFVKYIQELEDLNRDRIPERKSIGRLGYIPGEGFSPYVDGLIFDGNAEYAALFSSVHSRGSEKIWVETAAEARAMSTTAKIMLAAAFASALLEPVNSLPFFVHLWGVDSGTGKTVALMLAASVWGDPRVGAYVKTFDATDVGLEKTAAFLNSLPLCLDELQLSRDERGRSKFSVYKLAQGVGRTRGNRGGGVDITPVWHNCTLTTGESPLTGQASGAGAVNRVIDIECTKYAPAITDGMKISAALKKNYGFAGRRFAEQLYREDGSAIEEATARYQELFRLLSERDTTEKQAMAAAAIILADELACEWIFNGREKPLTCDEMGEFLASKAAVSAGDRAYKYRAIFHYFRPEKLIGFTATPNRGDKVRLDDVFSEIIFQRDLRWGIENGYLCGIYCRRVDIGFDLSAVHTRQGDYAPGELAEAMEGTADAIAEAYHKLAVGATLIFAVSVHQAEEIAKRIPGAVVVTGETKDRASIIRAFTEGTIPCIVNCMVFTEGTDIPRVETVIIARPTQSESLYAQMVGRGLRLYPGKQQLVLIDCVGITGRANLCTAPSLLGLDMENVPKRKEEEIEGDLFELPEKIAAATDTPESWIKNIHLVDVWAKEQSYNTHDINLFKMPDGSLVVSLTEGKKFVIPCPDSLGMVRLSDGSVIGMQAAIDRLYTRLTNDFQDCRSLWDLNAVKRWGAAPATDKQLDMIRRRCRGFDTRGLTKGDASQILNRLFNEPRRKRRVS